jgi:NAD(P)-dependent dehydrogenase (short-subunit alcohol dehydrogenase family)
MGSVKTALEATTRELASELGPRNTTVNALPPEPLATRAASGIAHFGDLMDEAVQRSSMRRLATVEDVGAAAAFLSSEDRVIEAVPKLLRGGEDDIAATWNAMRQLVAAPGALDPEAQRRWARIEKLFGAELKPSQNRKARNV